jgi:hypothetical protein
MDTDFQGLACPEYEARLEDFLSGVLVGPEAQNIAKNLSEHVKVCAGCRAALDAASSSARLLRWAQPTPDPGPEFTRNLMALLRAEGKESAGEGNLWKLFVPLAWRFAATAALVLVALVAYDVTASRNRPQPNVALVPAREARDIFPDPAGLPRNRDEVLMMVAETNHGNQ